VVRLLVLAMLSGCASDWQAMNCHSGIDRSLIVWERTAHANAECRKLGMDEHVIACAQCSLTIGDNSSMCVIFSKPDVEDRFLGHELRHAFGCSHKT